MTHYYAGIGSRETPPSICSRFVQWGQYLHASGYTLRSGGARRADQAFERGCNLLHVAYPKKQIFTVQDARFYPDWGEHAKKYHPAWGKCSDYARLLHARNSAILLGHKLDAPVNFVLCWTKDGKATGGTGQALRIAEALDIPVFNWFYPDCEDRLREYLGV